MNILIALALAAAPAFSMEDIVPRDWLVLAPVDARGRRPFRPDVVFRRHLMDESDAPAVGGELTGETGEPAVWEAREATEDGTLGGARFGYAYTAVEVPEARVVLAQLQGASALFVNGKGYAGDVYRFGLPGVPVPLAAGRNDVFVTGNRGGFRLQLRAPEGGRVLAGWDTTKPHVLRGRPIEAKVGVLLVNPSLEATPRLAVVFGEEEGLVESGAATIPNGLPPLGMLKLPLEFTGKGMPRDRDALEVPVKVIAPGGSVLAEFAVTLEARDPGAMQLRTYVSTVDGSVQEYAVVPPVIDPLFQGERGLALSLHGAGVTAWRQASCYAPKPDFWVVCPTNRRPFGFDWQDWGRRDAYDVLALGLAESGVDRSRVYVTGHSMGGHGTWHLAANDLDGFAACGPSAAWESFDSYGGRPEGELTELWHSADAASKTLALVDNLCQVPAYVLHGTKDGTVPVSEALTMIEALTEADATVAVHMQGGAGHWWGNQCMDWGPIFEFFNGRTIPSDPARIDFTTVDPGVDAAHHWVRVEQPIEYGQSIRIQGERTPEGGGVKLTTENARWISVTHDGPVEVDGREVPDLGNGARTRWLLRGPEGWAPAQGPPTRRAKRAARSGPFKRAFDKHFVLVYGTRGNARESDELYHRARYDAQLWWYRGNGLAELMSDEQLARTDTKGRNLILYGNRDTNSAFSELPEDCPLDVARGRLALGETVHEGEDLAAVFVYPRAGDDEALVGVFADTGARATRLGYTLAPFVSGVGYPDYAVFSSEVLTTGDSGVLAAGWFDGEWRLP